MFTKTNEPPPASYGLTWRDRLPGPVATLLRFPWWQFAVAIFAAVLLAKLINTPNARIIKALAGIAIFAVAYKTRPFYALCFIMLFMFFPFSIFVGSSTMIFVVLAATIYLARLTQKQVAPLQRTPIDLWVGLMIACYFFSFYNVDNPVALQRGALNMFAIIASFILYYMAANFIKTEDQLKTVVKIFSIVIGLSIFVGLYELFFPGRVLIPHWILYGGEQTAGVEGYRVGGPLYDYELFGEFMAMSFFLCLFLFRRANSTKQKAIAAVLGVLCIFMLLTTVTRGATLAFVCGMMYLLWSIRKSLKLKDVVMIIAVAVVMYIILNFFVQNFTRSGSIIERLFKTEFVGGIPDSRTGWPKIFARALEHPIVGHGPYYDLGQNRGFTGKGLYSYIWPHCQYLYYAHTIGFLGVGSFLALMIRLVFVGMKSKATSLRDSYPDSLLIVFTTMLVIFILDQIKIDYLRNDIYQYFPWLLFGLIVSTARIAEEKRRALASGQIQTEANP